MSVQELRSGDGHFPLPPAFRGLPVLAREEPGPLPDPAQALARALASPCAGPSLEEFLKGRARVCLVLPDATRPMPPALVEELLERLASYRPSVRIANGIHRRTTEADLRRLLGRHFGRVPAGDRSADDAEAHAPAGRWRIDRVAAESDALVLMGPLSFHYLAGFGGGGKLVAPGLADRATAQAVHAGCLDPFSGRAPTARAGVLDGNPLRQRIEEICQAAPPQFYVLPLLDSSGRAVGIRAGARQAAFARACADYAGAYTVAAARHRAVFASAGGAPFDLDFVQAHKALEAAAHALRPGGSIVLVASCREGLPERHRRFLAAHPTAAAMERALRERFDIAGHTVWAARQKAERFRILLVSQMDPALVSALGMEPVGSLVEAVSAVGTDDAALLPFGARFLPVAGAV